MERGKEAEGGHAYGCSKTYTHSVGLSCCFRQHKAASHCAQLHGYPLEFKLEFSALHLDDRNWVVNFGGLKPFRHWLERQFDHTTLVAEDDPDMDWFLEAAKRELITIRVVPATGCEAIARWVFEELTRFIGEGPYGDRVCVSRVTVSEHDGNSAWYGWEGITLPGA